MPPTCRTWWTIEGAEGNTLKLVRQEFGGQVSAHVRCDISSGAVLNIRPGAFKPAEGASAGGTVIDKSAGAGALTSRRRYLETIAAEAGDVDITNYPVLVSIGRGIEERENCAIAQDLADAHGRGGELLAPGGGRQVDGEIAAGGIVRDRR